MIQPRIVILQHASSTPPGTLVEWLTARGYQPDVRQLYLGDTPPDARELDWLIVLGGSMNVDEVDKYSWLLGEKDLIRKALELNKTCLGLCLGGQLIAQALGAAVRPNAHWEAGWHDVALVANDERLRVFQWHQDTFELPAGARRIATSDATSNQAFTFGRHVLAVQFHPEASAEWIRECAHDRDQPPAGRYTQRPEEVMAGLSALPKLTAWFFARLDELESLTVSRLASSL